MKKKLTVGQICSVVCAVLLLALVVCQFMPFWTAEEESVSIQKCVWLPQECKDITKMLDKTVEVEINDIVLMPVVVLVSGVVGAFFCAVQPKKIWAAICPLACGIVGSYGYLTMPAFQLGSMWILHLLLSILILLLGVVIAILLVKEKVSKKHKKV